MIGHDPRAAFRSPAFRRFLAYRVLALLSLQIQSVVIGWQVYDLTGRALDLGLVGLVQFLPQLLLFPVTGTAVDRYDRKWILVACNVVFATCGGLLALLSARGDTAVGPVFAVVGLMAFARAFSAPAQTALLPLLVPREHYPNAVNWSSTTYSLTVVAGPALGGALYAVGGGAVLPYAVALGLSLAAAALLSTVTPAPQERVTDPPTLDLLLAGLRFIRTRPVILSAITLDLFAVLFGGAVALLPIYARDILEVGPVGLGMLRGAPAVGAALTASWLAWRPLRRRVGRTLYLTVAVFGLATIVFGLSTELWLSLLALVVVGCADEVSVVIRQNVVQLATPDHMRGRVSAAEFVFIGASNELGELESGLVAAWVGPVWAVVSGGVGSLVVVAASAAASKELREVDRLEDLREQR